MFHRIKSTKIWLLVALLLNACADAVEDSSQEPTTENPPSEYHVKVSVNNLLGSGLKIQNNGVDNLDIFENITYQFPVSLLDTDTFDISVLVSPSVPNQVCTPNPQSGVINKSDLVVDLNCVTEQYTIGGNVTGLSGSGLTLQLNGSNDLAIDSNATEFSFLQQPLADNSDYQVSILNQPSNPTQYCKLTNGTGILAGTAVNDIQIQCFDETVTTRHFPPVQAQRVPRNSVITAQLSQAIDETTLSDTVLTLTGSNGVINGGVTYDANTYTLRFTPILPLEFGMQYSVVIGNGLQDTNDNPVIDSWGFQTTNSQFTKSLANNAATTIDNSMFSTTNLLREQLLYTGDALAPSAGFIHAVSFSYATDLTSEVKCSGVTIKLGHSGVSELNTSFATNVNEGHGSQEAVLNNADLLIPAGNAGDYFSLMFDNSFYYNGVDNLVIELQRNQCSANVDIILQNEMVSKRLMTTLSGLTGNLSQNLARTNLLFTGGDNAINYPLATNPAYDPFTINTYSWRVLALFPATDINGGGWINGVAFKLALDSTAAQSYTFAVKMAHSNRASLDSQVVDSNYAVAPEIITDTVTIDIPASSKAGQYIWIPFAKGFLYNGESNLIVELVVSSASGETPLELGTPGGTNNRYLRGQTFTTWAEGSYTDSFNIALRFADSSMDVIPASFFQTADYPFNGTNSSKMQLLYDKTELGSSGLIKKLSLRLSQAANVETYENVNITLGHTSNNALNGVFADNMLNPVSVYNGNITLGGNLSTGDWIEVVLDTPFAYDAKQNLVIQITLDAGLNGQDNLLVLEYSTQYNGRIIYATDRAATSSNAIFGNSRMPIKIGM